MTFINCSIKFPNIHDVIWKYGIKEQIPCLFVFDNLMFLSDIKDNWGKSHNYVTKDCHHSNCSLIFVHQDLLYRVEIFQNIGDKRNLYHVFQMHKLSRKVKKILEDIFGNGGRYIVLDNILSCPPNA